MPNRNTLPPSVNFHILNACNYSCGFCFAVFADSAEYLGKGQLPLESQLAILEQLAKAGVSKITFAGGEPTLSPTLPKLLEASKALGMTTMVVTNGSRLLHVGGDLYPNLDWLVLSVDSVDVETNLRSGRAYKDTAMTADQYLDVAERARSAGVRIKMNTVVHQLNARENLTEFVLRLRPERWKVFQVLPVEDQNGAKIEQFRISTATFDRWLKRNRPAVESAGIPLVSEHNEEMRGSYAMIDPAGRFYDSAEGTHTYSRPILEVGIEAAFAQVNFDHNTYIERGGKYAWDDVDLPTFVALAGASGSGKDTAGEALVRDYGYIRIAVADRIKRVCQEVLHLSDEQLWGESRNTVVEGLCASPRAVYQRLGSAIRKIDDEFWVRAWRREIAEATAAGQRVICTDVRTEQELEAARELGATTILIMRTETGLVGALAEHPTEVAARGLSPDSFDAHVENDGTIGELIDRVAAVIIPTEDKPTSSGWRPVVFTSHARDRMREREISEADVQYIIKNGDRFERGRKIAYKLDENVPRAEWWARALVEITVLIEERRNRVVTVFRDDVERDEWIIKAKLETRHSFTLRDALDSEEDDD